MRWFLVCVFSGLLLCSSGCTAVPPCPVPGPAQLPASAVPPTVPESTPSIASPMSPATLALEQKIKVQEKRIADLTTQLLLLKRIDLDRSKQ